MISGATRKDVTDSSDPIIYVIVHGRWWNDSHTSYLDGFIFSPRELNHTGLVSGFWPMSDRMNSNAISVIKEAADESRTGGWAKVSSMSFTLNDQDGELNQALTGSNFDIHFSGRRVDVRINLEEVTNHEDDPVLWSGYIRQPKRDFQTKEILFECEGVDTLYKKKIPPRTWESDDLDSLEVRGKPIPLLIGSHDMVEGFVTSESANTGYADAGRVVTFGDRRVGYGFSSIDRLRWSDSGLLAATGGFAEIKDAAVYALGNYTDYSVTAAQALAYFNDIGEDTIHLYVDITPNTPILNNNHSANASNHMGAVGGTGSATTQNSEINNAECISFKIPKIDVDGTIEFASGSPSRTGMFVFSSVTGYCYHDPYCEYQMFIGPDYYSGSANIDQVTPGLGWTISPIGDYWSYLQTSANVNTQLTIELLSLWNSDYSSLQLLSDKIVSLGIYNSSSFPVAGNATTLSAALLGLRIYFTMEFPSGGFMAEASGYTDDVFGTYTGTSLQLIENPVDVVGFLLQECAEYNITMDSATKATVRSMRDLSVARQIVELESVTDIIDQLARECSFCVRWAADESLTFFTFEDKVTPDLSIKESDLIPGSVSVDETDYNEIVTDFKFLYKWNPILNDYQETLYCNSSGYSSAGFGAEYSTACDDAKEKYTGEEERSETFEFAWARNEEDAVSMAQRYVQWHTQPRSIVTLAADLSLVGVEIGDHLDFAADEFAAGQVPTDGKRYVVVSKDIDPKTMRIRFKLLRTVEALS
jgi:hypothetical protein